MKSKMQKFAAAKKKVVKTRKKDFKKVQERRRKKKETDDAEIATLSSRLWPNFDDPKEDIPASSIKTFTILPISQKTLKGLQGENFLVPTDIQRESLMYALKGHDILGAAKTGSGKTLAFLVPILEVLFKQRYTPSFGMAALVISPTRELAYQSFDVLKKIGKFHDLSFGLVTGGMHLKEEASKMNNTNVVICTPGRLLQHFEQTPNFTADELKILVLDEADKILHMGFSNTMNAIVESLPKQRQTLLFSATQTKSVKDLARLSLKRPIYVSVHEKSKQTTPTSLDQRYIICESQDKVNTLWSFIRSHKHKKILVFLSCCKQVRYLHQVFRKMQPGLTVLGLHGHMKQNQRMDVYNTFTRKQHAVLLATDVAARGLDFPVVNWVVQMDKPDSVDTYIHRVGRTARYEKVGEALLVLLPSEEKIVQDLIKRKIPIVKLRVSKKRMFDVTKKLESLCASDKELKHNAQKGYISAMKTLFVLDRASFHTVDQDAFAVSLGLVQAPPLTFVKKSLTAVPEGDDRDDEGSSSDEEDSESDEEEESEEEDGDDDEQSTSKETKNDKLNKQVSSTQKVSQGKALNFMVESDEEDDIYNIVKNVKPEEEEEEGRQETTLPIIGEGQSSKKKSRAKEKLKLLKYVTRVTFDEDGNPDEIKDDDEDEKGLNIEQARKRMREQDKIDKETQRQRIKQEHREKRLKEKEKRRQEQWEKNKNSMEEDGVALGTPSPTASDEDNIGDNVSNEESNDDDDEDSNVESDIEEPERKKRKLARHGSLQNTESTLDSDDDDNDDDDDEDVDDYEGKDEDSDESEEDAGNDDLADGTDSDEDIKLGSGTLEGDEAAVLALLSNKR